MRVSSLEQKRVLIVEDDVEILDLLRSFLSEIGIEKVSEAKSGPEALEFIDNQKKTPDLVICDWNMPEMSGLSVYNQLKVSHPNVPFILVTSRNDYESVREAKEAGLKSYLVKPLSIEQLGQKVTTALRH